MTAPNDKSAATWHPDDGPTCLSLWDRILLAVMQGPVRIGRRR